MSDKDIKRILIERKKQARKAQRREEVIETAGGFIGWLGLFATCFMLSVMF